MFMSGAANKLIKGSLLRTVSWALNIAVAFFMMPFLIHTLGDRWYGFWILVTTFIGYYGILDLGLSSAVARFVSQAIGRNDNEELNCVVTSALVVYSGIALFSFLITFGIVFSTPFFIKNPEEVGTFKLCILLLGIAFSMRIIFRAFGGILSAHFRYDLEVYITLIQLILRTSATVFFIKNGYGIISLAIISVVLGFVEIFLQIVFIRKIQPSLEIGKRFFVKSKIKELFQYGGITFVAQFADHLRFNIDNMVISAFVGVDAIAMYAIPVRLSRYFGQLIASLVGMMSPVFSRYEGLGDYDTIRTKWLFTIKLSSILASSIGFSIVFVGEPFIIRWMGTEYQSSYVLLLWFVVPHIFSAMQNPNIGLLYGISKHKYFAIANIIEGVCNLILSLILVQKFGILGVAMGTGIPMLILKFFVLPVFVTRVLSYNTFKYYRLLVTTGLGALGIQVVLRFLLKDFFVPNYLYLFSLGVLLAASSIIVGFFVILNKEERHYFIAFAQKIHLRK